MRLLAALLLLCVSLTASAEETISLFKPDGADFCIYIDGQKSIIINKNRFMELDINSRITVLLSGKKFLKLSDHPTGAAVAERMESLLGRMSRESMNAGDIRNFYNLVDTAIDEDIELLQRIRQLILQASNGTLNNYDRKSIQGEIVQLIKQVNLNSKFLYFNNISVIPELTAEKIGVAGVDVVNNLQNSIIITDQALTQIISKRVLNAVKSNVLNFRINGKTLYYINLHQDDINISEDDIAKGITKLVNSSILLKTGHGLLLKAE